MTHGHTDPVRRVMIRTALAAALAAPALGAHAAGALDRERSGLDRGAERHADRCSRCRTSRCVCHIERGWITIGRSRVDFGIGGCVATSIARALRHDGFHAYVRDGCVIVKGRFHRVRLNARGYRFTVWCEGHSTIIQPIRWHRSGHWQGHERRGGYRDDWRHDRRDFRRWHDRRYHRWHDRRYRRWGC